MTRILAVVVLSAAGLCAQSVGNDLYKDALAAMGKGDWAEAEFLFRDIGFGAPKDEQWRIGLMTALERQDKVQDALKVGRELIAQNGRLMTGHFRVGQLLLRLKRPTEAMAEFEESLHTSSTSSERAISYNMIGDAHRYMGELDESIAAFEKAKALGAMPNIVLATVLGTRGRHKEAIAEYRAVLKMAPDLPVALNNLAYTFAEQGENLDEALSLARRAVNVTQGNAAFVDTLGWVLFKKGMLADAEETILDALAAEGGTQPTLREHLGAVMDASGDWSGDRRELRKLLDGELTANQLIRMKELLRKLQ